MASTLEERQRVAIDKAMKALRRRHALEEGAHAPAISLLYRAYDSHGAVWKEKSEKSEIELRECYKAQAKLSEQLVEEVSECRNLKAQNQEKDNLINELQSQLLSARKKVEELQGCLEEKSSAFDLTASENLELRKQVAGLTSKLSSAEAENHMLIERWMLQKMQESERLNEANAMYEDMMNRFKASSIEESARQQVDGIVRQSELGLEDYVESSIPSATKHTVHAHEGGCHSLLFENNSDRLITGGQDMLVKLWDINSGTLISTLHGCLGAVLDLGVSGDNKFILGASSDHKLYLWDVQSGRIAHTLTGHSEKVCATDVSKLSNRKAVSAAYDRTIKVWDLHKGYVANTIICHSNCNSVSLTADGQHIYSGHVDGHLRFWDTRTGKLVNEVAAHVSGITSVTLSRNGQFVLTSGRDNLHNLFDVRSLEVCATFRAQGHRVANNWSRSCISADDNYVAAGSTDGTVYVWSRPSAAIMSTLKGHSTSVLACTWNNAGKPLVSADKNGYLHIWS
ncbi:autophagy-related protein 16 isoform X1 [Cryptomeria japonica]|uniref:autophagy-related protein 16 isoform X1 n=1 Tax=Cryptomeria japonica TaxID=3369 RepID=UPI0025AC0181|nr:autophagy-related protein 16 isoform X1 [Cryptomeria japonica]XP_057859109.1 autophagy-related protein 16 isoform X1 [Cryptomeria japonica]